MAGKKNSIEGVWRIVEVVGTGGNGYTDTNPLPNLMIVTRGHYMMMRDTGDKPRALYQTTKPTDAEKLAAFDSFFANGGTYELSGSTMTIHPTVARVPNYSAGGWTKYTVRIEGNNLYMTDKSTDTTINIGGKIVPIAPAGFETTTKFVRVE
jgi:hypothetical protein